MLTILYDKKDFQVFKKECERLIDLIGLKNWKVYIGWEQLRDERFAEITTDAVSMIANIFLTKKVEIDVGKDYKDNVKDHARHEVSHLLLGRISHMAKSRYIGSDEVYACEEEIVQLLSKIINKL